MRPAKVVSVVVGSLAALLALGLAAGGVALVSFHATERDDGFYTTSSERFETPTYGLTSERIDLGAGGVPFDPVDGVQISARSSDGRPVFVGIGRSVDVARYLAGVARDELTDVDYAPFRATLERHGGERAPAPPAEQAFWAASASGPGRQAATLDPDGGEWDVVVMNADASPGVSVDATVGVDTGLVLPLAIGLLVASVFSAAIAVVLFVVGLRRTGTHPRPAAGSPSAAAGPPPTPSSTSPTGAVAYPVRLDGRLDEPLSRWLWLVKWFLALPHLVVLAFLWVAFAVLTVMAGFAVLFTGRYPRGLFDFNVGVLRWTWRVTFYAFALGTDRYPPFSIHPDAGYPADLAVDYPERLSRGLVVVKWWLLALPHYLVVAVFGGGFTWWWWAGSDGGAAFGAGLIGLLVLVAAVALAFTGRYLPPVFDFVTGMYRWSYRVCAYAALLRDEYPPFRLDAGGTDPGSVVDVAPPPPPPTTPLAGGDGDRLQSTGAPSR